MELCKALPALWRRRQVEHGQAARALRSRRIRVAERHVRLEPQRERVVEEALVGVPRAHAAPAAVVPAAQSEKFMKLARAGDVEQLTQLLELGSIDLQPGIDYFKVASRVWTAGVQDREL